jgi:hypothetical protein
MKARGGFSERLERWLTRIPGIRTYEAREHRRETDKRVREQLAAHLQEARAYLKRLTLDLSQKAQLDPLDELDRLSSHIQQMADTIRYASYGYGGIFDLEKIREEELGRLYEFDLYLMDDIEAIQAEVNELRADLPPDAWGSRIREIEERTGALEQRFGRRRDFMTRAN